MTRTHAPNRAGRAGFTMIEILLAMGIFALGFIAVASIFPAGNVMQQATMNDIVPQFVVPYAETVMTTAKLSTANVPSTAKDTQQVVRIVGVEGKMSLYERGYPTMWGSTGGAGPYKYGGAADKDYYWVPLLKYRGTATDDWQAYIVVMDGRSGVTYEPRTDPTIWSNPQDPLDVPALKRVAVGAVAGASVITNAPNDLTAGDYLIDVAGGIHIVTERNGTTLSLDSPIAALPTPANASADPNAIWYAPPADQSRVSPAVAVGTAIVTLGAEPCRIVVDFHNVQPPQFDVISGDCPITVADITIAYDTSPGSGANGYTYYTAGGYNGDLYYCKANSSPLWKPTWRFGTTTKPLPTGSYNVYVTWVELSNRATNTPFTVFNGNPLSGGVSLGTVTKNQQNAPAADWTAPNGVKFERLGTYFISNGMLSLQMTNQANNYVIWDAVMLEIP
jgi:prepilin-type N-terminal cleavage/methylation domain-containing protein